MTARVLVVDDNETNRDLLSRRVSRAGHEVDTAEDGLVALAKLSESPFDLVLLDVMMPNMNGYETLERIKADEALSRTRVIMISALDEVDSMVKCIKLGADDYLPKPFNPTLLSARIASSLARKQADDLIRAQAEAMERDLAIGRRIQGGFFPQEVPAPPGWEVGVHFEAARQVGGDFYDVFTLPDGRLGFIIADVCDKGVGAALYMALFRTLFRAQLTTEAMSLSSATTWVSDYIATNHGDANMFATVFVAVVDPATGDVTYVNAGHDPPLLATPEGIETILPTAPAVGLLPNLEFPTGSLRLDPGGTLLCFTDGISEAMNANGEQFGEDRLREVLGASSGPASLVDDVRAGVSAFIGDVDQFDDMTLITIGRIA